MTFGGEDSNLTNTLQKECVFHYTIARHEPYQKTQRPKTSRHLTPPACAATEWGRSRNGVAVAVPGLVSAIRCFSLKVLGYVACPISPPFWMRLVHVDSQASASASSSRPKALTSKPGISIPSISLAFLTHSLSVITAIRSYFRTRPNREVSLESSTANAPSDGRSKS